MFVVEMAVGCIVSFVTTKCAIAYQASCRVGWPMRLYLFLTANCPMLYQACLLLSWLLDVFVWLFATTCAILYQECLLSSWLLVAFVLCSSQLDGQSLTKNVCWVGCVMHLYCFVTTKCAISYQDLNYRKSIRNWLCNFRGSCAEAK